MLEVDGIHPLCAVFLVMVPVLVMLVVMMIVRALGCATTRTATTTT